MQRWELYLLTAVSAGLFAWYALPQLFFAFYPMFELAQLLMPRLMSSLLGAR